MKLEDIRYGMRYALITGGSRRRPVEVMVTRVQRMRINGVDRSMVSVRRAKSGRVELVAPQYLHPAEIYDKAVAAEEVDTQRRQAVEAGRVALYHLLIKHGIEPRVLCISDDARAVGLEIEAKDLEPLTNLLRGIDGIENHDQEDKQEARGTNGKRKRTGAKTTAAELQGDGHAVASRDRRCASHA